MARKRYKRRQNNSTLLLGLVVLSVLLVVGLIAINGSSSASGVVAGPPPPAPLDKCGSPECGQASAPVTVDVYADFQCPYCARDVPVLNQLVGPYIDTGKARLVYHNFPVIGAESYTAAEAGLCAADQNQFWRYANSLFAHQGAENSGVFKSANLKKMAADLGLDTTAFDSCLDSGKHASQVQQEKGQGQQRGVQATPTFFVNGTRYEGSQTYQQLAARIEAAQPK